ncbi:TIGR03546 family protein [Catenovulum maritimum]|uniref:Membrane protein n=1 Tax=Catenovulum maritimum TaxID=1513271 RepID=A0A0J8GM27_9ALTE|nr:TIGR03546 family protein [Catenovulum maritimum]KMT63850.1 membrane protein [Catenovulum maritimum]
MITTLVKLFIALNSENSAKQIAYAVALGSIIGLTPLFSLHNLVVLILAFLIRVHLGTFFVSWSLFSLLGVMLTTSFSNLGASLLNLASLNDFWTSLYQITLFKLAHFHHTTTLGSLIISLITFMPITYLSVYLINKYRQHVMAFIMKFKVVQSLKASKFYSVYQSLSGR